jgi:ADP-heptose:LPS heptosyltransferase
VVHPGALGDVLLALPALAALGRHGFTRVLAAASPVAALLQTCGIVEEFRSLESLRLHELFAGAPSAAAARALGAHDAVVSWLGAQDPTYRDALARLGRRVVVAPSRPSVAPGEVSRHVAQHLLDTLRPLGADPSPGALRDVRLEPPAAEVRWAERWLGARGLATGRAIVLHPGAGSPAKVWPGFARLARRLQAAGTPVVVTTGPADARVLDAVAVDGEAPGSALAPDLPLPRLLALCAAARAFVGNDSGPSHLAALAGCPTVAVFGPTDPRLFRPLGPRVRVVGGERGGFGAVSVEVVEAELSALLAGGAALADRAGAVG